MKPFSHKLFLTVLIGLLLVQFFQPFVLPQFSVARAQSSEEGTQEKTPWQQINEKCGNGGWKGRAGLCLLGYVSALGLWASDAASGLVEKAEEKFKAITRLSLEDIFISLFNYLADILGFIVSLEMETVAFLLSPDTFQYATSSSVQAGFYVSLQVANGLLALGLVVLANKFILGKESYNDLKSLFSYLTTALLINFSLLFASYAIGIANFMTIAFLNFAILPETGNLGGEGADYLTRIAAITNQFAETFSGLVDEYGNAAQTIVVNLSVLFIVILLSAFLVVILAAIIVTLIKRVIALWILMMVLPLAMAGDTVLGTINLPVSGLGGGFYKKWESRFVQELSFAPIMAMVIWFTFLVLGNISESYSVQPEPEAGILMATFDKLIGVIAALVILYMGYTFAKGVSGKQVPAFVDKAKKKATNWGTQLRGYPWRTLSQGTVKFTLGKFADSEVGRTLQRKLANVPVASSVSHLLSGWATKRDEILKKEAEERAQKVARQVALYERMYNRAKSEEEKKRIIAQAKASMVSDWNFWRPDQRGAMLTFLAKHDRQALTEAIVEQAEREARKQAEMQAKGKKVRKAKDTNQIIEDFIKFGEEYNVGLDKKDIYRVNPMLIGDAQKIAKFAATEMGGEELAKLNEEMLRGVLRAVMSEGAYLSPDKLKVLIAKTAEETKEPGKFQAVLEATTALVQSNETVRDVLRKDGELIALLQAKARENEEAMSALRRMRGESDDSGGGGQPRRTPPSPSQSINRTFVNSPE